MRAALFWNSLHTIRYATTANLHGYDAIQDFRKARQGKGLMHCLRSRVITTYGDDFATASTEFLRDGVERIGRQTQT